MHWIRCLLRSLPAPPTRTPDLVSQPHIPHPQPPTSHPHPHHNNRNPTNLRNVEKVWIAEQKADAEAKKLQELKKQIAEERQLQELKELQVKAGLVDKGQLEKLDWMYEGPMATMQDHQSSTEQYLLGKEVELKAADSEVKKVESQPGMLFLNSVSAKNDLFTRLHEDPLLLIKQNELKVRFALWFGSVVGRGPARWVWCRFAGLICRHRNNVPHTHTFFTYTHGTRMYRHCTHTQTNTETGGHCEEPGQDGAHPAAARGRHQGACLSLCSSDLGS
jgi:hypothetical protein